MKLANVSGRAAFVLGETVADVATISGGALGPDLMSCYERWDELVQLASGVLAGTRALDVAELRCPVPAPRQVFAIGLNYKSHAEETKLALPTVPATFTKFPACLGGPFDDIELVGPANDWEVELVVVIGRLANRVSEERAWDHVAGLTVGQDISDRALQFAAGAQFSLGKSRRGYGPMGPFVVTRDELSNADDLALGCSIDGEPVQSARTSELIFSIPRLIAELSAVLPLLPGDVIFTGTPSGIGASRNPPRFLKPGNVIESWIEGIGSIRNRCV
jgi:2-keto-4-pentenoate hydratase/2-oxohepta-3-ene-1,7-dioic acid hydratase in catechol pathway